MEYVQTAANMLQEIADAMETPYIKRVAGISLLIVNNVKVQSSSSLYYNTNVTRCTYRLLRPTRNNACRLLHKFTSLFVLLSAYQDFQMHKSLCQYCETLHFYPS